MTSRTETAPTAAELLASKPSDVSKISFDASCFAVTGQREYWLIDRAGWAGAVQEVSPELVESMRKRGRTVHGPYFSAVVSRIKWH
jgi:hypothetical protein